MRACQEPPRTALADEDAEGMTGGVGEHVQRLLGVVGAVEQQLGSQGESALMVSLQGRSVGDGEVEMQLHRDLRTRPSAGFQLVDLLEREQVRAVGKGENQPVGIVRPVGRTLMARPVPKPQPLPVELGEAPDVGAVEDRVQQLRVAGHGLSVRRPRRGPAAHAT